jgi:hypothetical protein
LKKTLSALSKLKVHLMTTMMGRMVPNCEEASRRVSAAMDGPLPWRQRVGMHAHLLLCAFCRRYKAQLDLIRNAFRTGAEPPEGAVPPLPPEARDRIRHAIRSSSGRD